MKILFLGGTDFLGPPTVRAALAAGHEVTLFNRGKTNPQLFPELEKLRGDRRAGDLKALEGRAWDAVVDTSGYRPREVKDAAELLAKGGLKQYVFISSVSVYSEDRMNTPGSDEETELATLPPGLDPAKATMQHYGALKALCEQAAEAAMPGRTTNIRPGLIVGPGDGSDRFTYWPVRVDRGGEVLAPGDGSAAVQFIDVRDLADFIVDTIQDGHAGAYNAVGSGLRVPADRNRPWEPELTFREFLDTCKGVSGSPADLTWVDEEFLIAQGVGPWMELPLWIPTKEAGGFARTSNKKAVDHGLKFRPVGETIRDTLEWHKNDAERQAAEYKWGAGLKADKEERVLKAWKEREGK